MERFINRKTLSTDLSPYQKTVVTLEDLVDHYDALIHEGSDQRDQTLHQKGKPTSPYLKDKIRLLFRKTLGFMGMINLLFFLLPFE